MRKVLAVTLLLLALATPAWAVGPVLQTCTFSWGMPTVNSDGSPLTDLASFNLYLSPTPGGAGSLLGYLLTSPPTPVPGAIYTFVCPAGITAGQKYATVTALNLAGVESVRSNEVAFVFGNLALAPPAPTQLTVSAVAPPPTGTFLGVTGENVAGPSPVSGPLGNPDWHWRLVNVPSNPVAVQVLVPGGTYVVPGNGNNWLVVSVFVAGTLDVFVEPSSAGLTTPATIVLTYANGTTSSVTIP